MSMVIPQPINTNLYDKSKLPSLPITATGTVTTNPYQSLGLELSQLSWIQVQPHPQQGQAFPSIDQSALKPPHQQVGQNLSGLPSTPEAQQWLDSFGLSNHQTTAQGQHMAPPPYQAPFHKPEALFPPTPPATPPAQHYMAAPPYQEVPHYPAGNFPSHQSPFHSPNQNMLNTSHYPSSLIPDAFQKIPSYKLFWRKTLPWASTSAVAGLGTALGLSLGGVLPAVATGVVVGGTAAAGAALAGGTAGAGLAILGIPLTIGGIRTKRELNRYRSAEQNIKDQLMQNGFEDTVLHYTRIKDSKRKARRGNAKTQTLLSEYRRSGANTKHVWKIYHWNGSAKTNTVKMTVNPEIAQKLLREAAFKLSRHI